MCASDNIVSPYHSSVALGKKKMNINLSGEKTYYINLSGEKTYYINLSGEKTYFCGLKVNTHKILVQI